LWQGNRWLTVMLHSRNRTYENYRQTQTIVYLYAKLFEGIAPQNAEIRTVTKSLLLIIKNSAKYLFLN